MEVGIDTPVNPQQRLCIEHKNSILEELEAAIDLFLASEAGLLEFAIQQRSKVMKNALSTQDAEHALLIRKLETGADAMVSLLAAIDALKFSHVDSALRNYFVGMHYRSEEDTNSASINWNLGISEKEPFEKILQFTIVQFLTDHRQELDAVLEQIMNGELSGIIDRKAFLKGKLMTDLEPVILCVAKMKVFLVDLIVTPTQ